MIVRISDLQFQSSQSRHFPCQVIGSVAEWSKALVLGISLFRGVGSNQTAATMLFYLILYVMSFDEEADTEKKIRGLYPRASFFDLFSGTIQLTKIIN